MTDINDRIREALRADTDEALADLADEPDLFEQVIETFRGRNRFVVLLFMAAGTVFMVLGVLCVVRMFGAEEVRTMLAWGFGAYMCFSAILGMKIWYWMELQKNAITREIKRLELQVTRLIDRV